MKMRAIPAVLFWLVVLACGGPVGAVTAPRPVAGSPRGDLILFRAGDVGTPSLWTVWGDGSHLSRLCSIGLNEGGAVWSPDGSKVAFEHWLSFLPDIVILDPSTGTEWRVTAQYMSQDPATWCYDVTWSPDGSSIYASSFAGRIVSIDVADPANPGAPQLLTDAPAGVSEGSPACGPDGLIAYVSNNNDDGNVNIRVLDPATGEDREVIGGVAQAAPNMPGGPIAWSPDGRYLAYRLYTQPGVASLAVAPLDGELPNFGTIISDLTTYGFAWSQTGRYIYCEIGGDLYRMKANGTSMRRIVSGDQVEDNLMEPSVVGNPAFPPGRAERSTSAITGRVPR